LNKKKMAMKYNQLIEELEQQTTYLELLYAYAPELLELTSSISISLGSLDRPPHVMIHPSSTMEIEDLKELAGKLTRQWRRSTRGKEIDWETEYLGVSITLLGMEKAGDGELVDFGAQPGRNLTNDVLR
jgi:hypothetical protein